MNKRVSSTTDNNRAIMVENKANLRELESQYVDSVIDNLPKLVEEKKKEITDKLIDYQENCKIKKYDKKGNEYNVLNTNPLVIQNYFFKSINPISSIEPKYNAEKLGIVWDLYEDMVGLLNLNIGTVIPNLTTFCKVAGITLTTFKAYRNSSDENMRILTEKIDDICFDGNVTLAQMGMVSERSTMFRMKSEQERVEKERPVVHIHNEGVDLGDIQKRLNEIRGFNKRKSGKEPPIIEVKDGKVIRGYADGEEE